MRNYSGNTKPFVLVLCADDAREKADGLIGKLSERGLALCVENGSRSAKGKAVRAFAVIALLSKGFAESEKLQDALFAADEAGTAIIPVHMDDAEQSDAVQRILFARNALFASNYRSAEEFAARIVNGSILEQPFITGAQKKARKRSLAGLISGAAVIAAAAIALFLYDPEPPVQPIDTVFLTDGGITAEMYSEISNILIIGDQLYYTSNSSTSHRGYRDEYVSSGEETDENGNDILYYYRNEDGSKVESGYFESLDFLTLLPSLKSVELVCVDSPALPDLSECLALTEVALASCTITDISGLSGSNITYFESSRTPVADYAPLNGCEDLNTVFIDLHSTNSSLDGFGPASLESLTVNNGNGFVPDPDFSGLANCTKLQHLSISCTPLDNIDFAANMPELRDIYLEQCDVSDITPLAGCRYLQEAVFQDLEKLTDISTLGSLKNLKRISAHCPIKDLNFLKDWQGANDLSLEFSRPMNDYSGLAAVESFNWLHCNLDGGSYSLVSDYLKDKRVATLDLFEVGSVDLAELPDCGTLILGSTPVEDLSGIREDSGIAILEIRNCRNLRSLNGIEKLSGLTELYISNCLRLSDYEGIYSLKLEKLSIDTVITLPDISRLSFTKRFYLTLGNIPGLDSLDILRGITVPEAKNTVRELDISGLDEVTDLSPLYDVKGWRITVSPQLADQAEDLVESGTFKEVNIVYDGGWNDIQIELTSFEDLETYPAALLEKVAGISITGEYVNSGWLEFDDTGRAYLGDGEGVFIDYLNDGPLADLSLITPLTGLTDLDIQWQNRLTSLDGIQALQQLEHLQLNNCRSLSDVTPVYTLGGLRFLSVVSTSITDIEGIENLRSLEELYLPWNDFLTDLTPLLDLPNLRMVYISSNMEDAIASLEGQGYDFELVIEG